MSASLEEVRAAVESLCGEDRAPFAPAGSCEAGAECRLVRQIVSSFLLWESTLSRADRASQAVATELMDINELRVCLPGELVSIIGVRYPRAEERSLRLRACLNAIFDHEHRTAIPEVEIMGKREARVFLESLEGMVPFVAARVVLIELGGHCFPVDSRVAHLLEGVTDPDEPHASIASKLERAFRAGEIGPVYAALERRIETLPPRSRSSSRFRRSGSRAP